MKSQKFVKKHGYIPSVAIFNLLDAKIDGKYNVRRDFAEILELKPFQSQR